MCFAWVKGFVSHLGGRARQVGSAGPPLARPFDGAQGERPLTKDGFQLSAAGMTDGGGGDRGTGVGVRLQKGWVPASAGMTGGAGWGGLQYSPKVTFPILSG